MRKKKEIFRAHSDDDTTINTSPFRENKYNKQTRRPRQWIGYKNL